MFVLSVGGSFGPQKIVAASGPGVALLLLIVPIFYTLLVVEMWLFSLIYIVLDDPKKASSQVSRILHRPVPCALNEV